MEQKQEIIEVKFNGFQARALMGKALKKHGFEGKDIFPGCEVLGGGGSELIATVWVVKKNGNLKPVKGVLKEVSFSIVNTDKSKFQRLLMNVRVYLKSKELKWRREIKKWTCHDWAIRLLLLAGGSAAIITYYLV